MQHQQNELRLLPNYFKKIAFVLLVISISLLVLKLTKILFVDKSIFKIISINILLIALLMFALAKDKVEDELTLKLRSQAYSLTFLYGVIFTIFSSILNFVAYTRPQADKSAYEVLIQMFVFYFIVFYTLKRKR